jgi:hypothetical protein
MDVFFGRHGCLFLEGMDVFFGRHGCLFLEGMDVFLEGTDD